MKINSRKFRIILSGIILFATTLMLTSTYAAETADFTISSTIYVPLSIACGTDMTFPNSASKASAYTVVVAPTDTGAAECTVTNSDASIHVFTATLPTTITLTGPGDAITVDTFEHGSNLDSQDKATVPASGSLAFKLGATEHINAAQAAGDYTGEATVTIAVNS